MLNACIVGYGLIAPVHAKSILELSNGNIYGICDINKERADEGAKKYDAKAFYDFDDVLNDKNIDVVHICTPHYLHEQMALKSLENGINVVLEKPMSINESEFDMLLKAYENANTKICSVFQNRTNTGIEKLKQIIEEDDNLGELKGISGTVRWHRTADYYNHDMWRGKIATEGGGVLINQAIHLLDLMTYFGGKVKSVCATASNKSLKNIIEVEDTIDACIEFESPLKGSFYATNSYPIDQPFQLELNFDNKTFRYADNNLYKIENGEIEFIIRNNMNTNGKCYWGSGHRKVIYDFYNAIENGGEYIDLKDSINTTRTMFAIYKSAKNKGDIIKL